MNHSWLYLEDICSKKFLNLASHVNSLIAERITEGRFIVVMDHVTNPKMLDRLFLDPKGVSRKNTCLQNMANKQFDYIDKCYDQASRRKISVERTRNVFERDLADNEKMPEKRGYVQKVRRRSQQELENALEKAKSFAFDDEKRCTERNKDSLPPLVNSLRQCSVAALPIYDRQARAAEFAGRAKEPSSTVRQRSVSMPEQMPKILPVLEQSLKGRDDSVVGKHDDNGLRKRRRRRFSIPASMSTNKLGDFVNNGDVDEMCALGQSTVTYKMKQYRVLGTAFDVAFRDNDTNEKQITSMPRRQRKISIGMKKTYKQDLN